MNITIRLKAEPEVQAYYGATRLRYEEGYIKFTAWDGTELKYTPEEIVSLAVSEEAR